MTKRLEGSYLTVTEAFEAVENLRNQGLKAHQIYLVANEEVRETIPYTPAAEVTSAQVMIQNEQTDAQTLWERVKEAFTFDDYDSSQVNHPDYKAEEDSLYLYRADLAQGNILVLVDDEMS